MWHYDSKGLFSVKSAYKVAISLQDTASSSSPNPTAASTWNKIWKASVPGKEKVFVWNACCNILPTRSNLEKKGVVVDNICVFCSSSSESSLHVFSACPFARTVFSSSKLNLGQQNSTVSSFWDWFMVIVESLPPTCYDLFLMRYGMPEIRFCGMARLRTRSWSVLLRISNCRPIEMPIFQLNTNLCLCNLVVLLLLHARSKSTWMVFSVLILRRGNWRGIPG